MINNELSNECVITRVSNAVATGTTAVVSNPVDMTGYAGVCFIAVTNTITGGSVLSLSAYENTTTLTAGSTLVTGSATAAVTDTAGATSNGLWVSDVVRPSKQYVYAQFNRATQAATLDGILAIQYRARKTPVSQPATTVSQVSSVED